MCSTSKDVVPDSLTVELKLKYLQVEVYINTEEEKNLKTTVWEEINREYLEVLKWVPYPASISVAQTR